MMERSAHVSKRNISDLKKTVPGEPAIPAQARNVCRWSLSPFVPLLRAQRSSSQGLVACARQISNPSEFSRRLRPLINSAPICRTIPEIPAPEVEQAKTRLPIADQKEIPQRHGSRLREEKSATPTARRSSSDDAIIRERQYQRESPRAVASSLIRSRFFRMKSPARSNSG